MRGRVRRASVIATYVVILWFALGNGVCFPASDAMREHASPPAPDEWLVEELRGKVPFFEIQLRDFPGFPVEEQKKHPVLSLEYLYKPLGEKFPQIKDGFDGFWRRFVRGDLKWFPESVYFAYPVVDAEGHVRVDAEGNVRVDELTRQVPLEAARIVAEALNRTFEEKVRDLKEGLDRKTEEARKVEEELESLTSRLKTRDPAAEEKQIAERIGTLEASLFECRLKEAEIAARQEVLRGRSERPSAATVAKQGAAAEFLRDAGWMEWRRRALVVFITPRVVSSSPGGSESDGEVSIEARFVVVLPSGREVEPPQKQETGKKSSSDRLPGEQPTPGADQADLLLKSLLELGEDRRIPPPEARQLFSLRGILTPKDFGFVWDAISKESWCRYLIREATVQNGARAALKAVKEVTYTSGNGERVAEEGLVIEVTPSVSKPSPPGSLSEPLAAEPKDQPMTLILMPRLSRVVAWTKKNVLRGESAVTILEPEIETQQATTTVHLNGGETVVLGGVLPGLSIGLRLPAQVEAQETAASELPPEVAAELARLEAEAAGVKARKEMLEAEIERLQKQRKRIALVLPQYEKLREELAARKELLLEARKKYIEANDALKTSRPRVIEHLPSE